MHPGVQSAPPLIEQLTKPLILASLLAAAWAQTWGAALVWPSMRFAVPAVFAAAWLGSRLRRAIVSRVVLFSCYLVPAAFILLGGNFYQAGWSIWFAALIGMIAGTAPFRRWSIPNTWKFPLVFWGLIVAFTWPLIVVREADFYWRLIEPTMVVWIVTAAMMTLVGILWFDSLCANFGTGDDALAAFERDVAMPMGAGFFIAGCVGVYQMLGHITFLNASFWSVLHRATGTLGGANEFGVISAMWGPLLFALAFNRGTRWQKAVGVTALLLSWVAVWASGSRSSLLIVALSLVAIVVALWRHDRTRKTLAVFAIAASLVIVLAVAIVSLTGGVVIGPVARFVQDFAPRWSVAWAQEMVANLWRRGSYGPVAEVMIQKFPLTGVGVGGFHYAWSSFSWMIHRLPVPADNAQSWYRHELAELGMIGSIGWVVWTASFGWALVSAAARQGQWLTSGVIRTVVIGFGLISLVGMPGQEVAVVFTFWTMAFWFTLTIVRTPEAHTEGVRRSISTLLWVSVLAIVGGYTALTAYEGRTMLRPPLRAVMADMDYWVGLYDAEGVINGAEYRWAKQNALAVIATPTRWVELTVWVNHFDVKEKPVDVRVWRDRKRVMQLRLTTTAPITAYLRVPPDEKWMILETWVSRVVYPREFGVSDERELGLLVRWNAVDVPPPGAMIVQ